MLNKKIIQAVLLALISIPLLLSGCAGVGSFRQREPLTRVMSFGFHSPATHKLKSVQVVLSSNQTTYVNISKAATGSKPTIDASDNLRAEQYLNEIRQSIVGKTKEQLFKSGVVEGGGIILELTLTEGYYNTNEQSGNVVVKTTIKQRGTAQDLWNISILSYSPERANHEVLLNNFASRLVSELQAEGWL